MLGLLWNLTKEKLTGKLTPRHTPELMQLLDDHEAAAANPNPNPNPIPNRNRNRNPNPNPNPKPKPKPKPNPNQAAAAAGGRHPVGTDELMVRWINHHLGTYMREHPDQQELPNPHPNPNPNPNPDPTHPEPDPNPHPNPNPNPDPSPDPKHPDYQDVPAGYKVSNLHSDLADSTALTIVMHQLAPHQACPARTAPCPAPCRAPYTMPCTMPCTERRALRCAVPCTARC